MKTLRQHYAEVCRPLSEQYLGGELHFEEKDLIYSATERCKCGAGLARVNCPDVTMRFWHCSECLLRGMDPSRNSVSDPFDDSHDAPKEFYRVEIKEEGPAPQIGLSDSLAAHYLSTRPNAEYAVYTVFAFGNAAETPFSPAPVNTADEAVAKSELWRLASQHGTVHMTTRHYVRNG